MRSSVKIKAIFTKKYFTPVLFIKYQTNHSIWCADIWMCELYYPSSFSSIAEKYSQTHFAPEIHRKCNTVFEKYKVLTAHELHIYELLKFVMKSVNKMHTDTYLNELFFFESRSNNSTRRSSKWFLKVPKCKRNSERNSLRYRGAKLLNIFMENNMLPSKYKEFSSFSFVSLVHKIRDNYILSNYELTKTIFS